MSMTALLGTDKRPTKCLRLCPLARPEIVFALWVFNLPDFFAWLMSNVRSGIGCVCDEPLLASTYFNLIIIIQLSSMFVWLMVAYLFVVLTCVVPDVESRTCSCKRSNAESPVRRALFHLPHQNLPCTAEMIPQNALRARSRYWSGTKRKTTPFLWMERLTACTRHQAITPIVDSVKARCFMYR